MCFISFFMKKSVMGQVSVFVIIAILIVSVGGGISYIVKSQNDAKLNEEFFSQSEIKVQVDNIESAILSCVDSVSREGLEVIGFGGGYYNKPAESFEIEDGFVPYYYDKGDFLMPSREKISKELADYVSNELEGCLNGLVFENFDLKLGRGNVEVVIGDDEVLFEIDKNVRIEREGRSIIFDLEEHGLSVKSALNDILEIAEYITDSHKDNVETFCISCVGEMAEERDVYVKRTLLSDNKVLVIIGENRTADDVYLFSFLNRYTGDEVDDFGLNGEVLPRKPDNLEDL